METSRNNIIIMSLTSNVALNQHTLLAASITKPPDKFPQHLFPRNAQQDKPIIHLEIQIHLVRVHLMHEKHLKQSWAHQSPRQTHIFKHLCFCQETSSEPPSSRFSINPVRTWNTCTWRGKKGKEKRRGKQKREKCNSHVLQPVSQSAATWQTSYFQPSSERETGGWVCMLEIPERSRRYRKLRGILGDYKHSVTAYAKHCSFFCLSLCLVGFSDRLTSVFFLSV